MNIFYIDRDPIVAAQSLVDKHVVKMILESVQLLSTAHRIIDGEMYQGKSKTGRNAKRWRLFDSREQILYLATHVNHPSAVWCRSSVENYNWLVEHLYAMMDEYTHRYGKVHKCHGELAYMLQSPPFKLKEWDWTDPPPAMDAKYIVSNDSLTNYRNYYRIDKERMHKWTNRQTPEWINENV